MARNRRYGSRYNANLTKASLKVRETRDLARFLHSHPSEAELKAAIQSENVLQKRNSSTAKTLAALILQRLDCLDSSLVQVLENGSEREATFITLVAAIKQSNLLSDFFEIVLSDLHKSFSQVIPPTTWDNFFLTCLGRDPSISSWTPAVVRKLRQNVFRILAESGYVEDTRSLKLVRVHVPSTIESSLLSVGENRVLRLLKVGE